MLTEKEEEELRERDQEMQNNGDGANEREAKKPAVETLGMGELSLGTFISNSPENGSSGVCGYKANVHIACARR